MAGLRDYSALSFDVYGTLIDWESGMIAGLRPLTERLDHEMSDDAILEMHARNESSAQAQTPGRLYSDLLATVYRRCAEELRLAVDWEECAIYGNSVPYWPAFPDSREALAYLKAHYRMIVLSNVDNRSFAGAEQKLGHRLGRGVHRGGYRQLQACTAQLRLPAGRYRADGNR